MSKISAICILTILLALILLFKINSSGLNESKRLLFDSEIDTIKKAIENMDLFDFEIFCAKLLSFKGYKYTVTPKSNDGGKDVILTKYGQTIYIECKHYKKKISREIAQKLCGAMIADSVSNGLIITLNGSIPSCQEYCKKLTKSKIAKISIEIVDLNYLIDECLKLDAKTIFTIAGIHEKFNFNKPI